MQNPENEIKASSNLKVYCPQIFTSYTICTNFEKKKKNVPSLPSERDGFVSFTKSKEEG